MSITSKKVQKLERAIRPSVHSIILKLELKNQRPMSMKATQVGHVITIANMTKRILDIRILVFEIDIDCVVFVVEHYIINPVLEAMSR
jgi:hypothetical protein